MLARARQHVADDLLSFHAATLLDVAQDRGDVLPPFCVRFA
jgi:hypothetical protein